MIPESQLTAVDPEKAFSFLKELSDLTEKYGLAIQNECCNCDLVNIEGKGKYQAIDRKAIVDHPLGKGLPATYSEPEKRIGFWWQENAFTTRYVYEQYQS